MWTFCRLLAAMAVAGIATFLVAQLALGKPQSGDEVLTNTRISIAAAILASLAPFILDYYLRHKGYERARNLFGTLTLMTVIGFVILFVAGFILLEFEHRIHSRTMKNALWLGAFALAILGFLAPGLIVWYRRMTSE